MDHDGRGRGLIHVTQEVVGTADYLSAGICSVTGMRPSAVCTDSAVTAAPRTLGLH